MAMTWRELIMLFMEKKHDLDQQIQIAIADSCDDGTMSITWCSVDTIGEAPPHVFITAEIESTTTADKTMKDDDLGDRMKSYEQAEAGRRCLPLLPVCVRIDGRCFSTWTRGLQRPFDPLMSQAMLETTMYLVDRTHAKIGYTQSDEISLIYHAVGPNSEVLFDGKIQKLVSVLASLATAKFNASVLTMASLEAHSKRAGLAAFDCRVWAVPNETEAANTILWRELDASKNSVSSAARHCFSHKALHGKTGPEMQEMMFKSGVNWNDYPNAFKRGRYVRRETFKVALDAETLAKIPEKHRPAPGTLVDRSRVVEIDMPQFTKVTNRVDVIFNGAVPIVAGETA